MKKILFMVLITLFFISCSQEIKNKDEIKEKNIENIEKTENIENIEKTENIEEKEEKKIFDMRKNDYIKFNKIKNNKDGLHFYYLDCNKLFKTDLIKKECQRYWLEEAGSFCSNKEYFKNKTIDEIFHNKKFNLIDQKVINWFKDKCIINYNEKKELEKEIKRENILNKKVENFKINNCDKWKDEFEIKRCQIWFAIKYKNDCSIINNTEIQKECIDIKKQIDKYNEMLENYNIYYNEFDLRDIIEPNIF